MESISPIDEECASEVSSLPRPPPPPQVQEYFDQLIFSRNFRGLKVKQNSELAKGVYADTDFNEEERVMKDQMLAGIQHSSNKMDCLLCSFCFRFIGYVELQIGRKLYLQRLGDSANNGCQMGTSSHVPEGCYDTDSSDMEDDCEKNHRDIKNFASSSTKDNISLPDRVVELLMNGELMLPYSNKFTLPSVIPCPGGCGEAYYCSKSCAEADWESFHALLCTERGANDIFLLAAKAICFTILRHRKMKVKAAHLEEQIKSISLESSNLSLLLEAWKPISIGYKRRWWDCIALPDDVDCSDEASFRMQIRELAFTLLKAAIFDKEWKPLFSLEIYGHIIGMFEPNNLDLVVAAPLEDYFLHIDDLPLPEKKELRKLHDQFWML